MMSIRERLNYLNSITTELGYCKYCDNFVGVYRPSLRAYHHKKWGMTMKSSRKCKGSGKGLKKPFYKTVYTQIEE